MSALCCHLANSCALIEHYQGSVLPPGELMWSNNALPSVSSVLPPGEIMCDNNALQNVSSVLPPGEIMCDKNPSLNNGSPYFG